MTATATTTSQALDQLVDEGYDRDAVAEEIGRLVTFVGLEITDQPEDAVLLTSSEVRLIRHRVTGEPFLRRTPLPCPEWCALREGHGFETDDGPRLTRVHARRFGDPAAYCVELWSLETAASEEGPVLESTPVLLSVHLDEHEAFTLPEALDLTQRLVDASRTLLRLSNA